MSTPASDLDTATIDELVAAIRSRCDVMVIIIEPKIKKDFKWAQYFEGDGGSVLLAIEKTKMLMMRDVLQHTLKEIETHERQNPKDDDADDDEEETTP